MRVTKWCACDVNIFFPQTLFWGPSIFDLVGVSHPPSQRRKETTWLRPFGFIDIYFPRHIWRKSTKVLCVYIVKDRYQQHRGHVEIIVLFVSYPCTSIVIFLAIDRQFAVEKCSLQCTRLAMEKWKYYFNVTSAESSTGTKEQWMTRSKIWIN